jgi:hypothetical protein
MTRRRQLLVLGGVLAVGVIAVAVWQSGGLRPSTTASGGGSPSASGEWRPPVKDPAAAARFKAAMAAMARAKVAEAGRAASVKRDEVLAHVNGTPIRGTDLLEFTGGPVDEQEVSPEMYAFLLDRAIGREVTFQEARRSNVGLTAEQRADLEKHVARDAGAARPDFERRDLEYQMLLGTLAARAGVPSPFPTQADVEAYYRAHTAELGPLPEDPAQRAARWAAIQLEIRSTLTEERQATFAVGLKDLLDGMKAAADVR